MTHEVTKSKTMTHDEITALQAKYAGSSRGPGKFQGESDWAAYYWDQAMDGCEDDLQYDPDDDTPISIFRVDDEDRLVFPELEDTVEVWICEDDQGFVETRVWYIGETIPSWDNADNEESNDQDPTEPSECDLVTTDHVHFYEHGMSKGRGLHSR